MKKKNKIPKKIKLIAECGFYKIIPAPEDFTNTIKIVLYRPYTIQSPLVGIQETSSVYSIEFRFTGVKGGYFIFRKSDVVEVRKK